MTFDRDLWQRARLLFDEIVELDTSTREKRLGQLNSTDPNLREAVERLLSADQGSEAALGGYLFGSPKEVPEIVNGTRDPLGVVGKTVSHFRVLSYLAEGGMGVVYTAEDLQLDRVVALKFPLPDQDVKRDAKERFINEARSAASLDHPNLCTVHEIGESAHGLFLAMPLYPGESLKERLGRQGSLPADEAINIASQVASGLASAHALGIVHRDLKPGNVMLLPDGGVKVLDFGLAKIRDISMTRSLMTLGTIGYVSPEQVRRGLVDARTDLWAIGVMLYEMLTGTLPFRGDHEVAILHAILHDEPSPPSTVNGTLSPRIDDVIDASLQKDPADRYDSANAMLADLAALQSGTALAHRSSFWSRTPRRRRLRSARFPIAALVLLVAVAAAGWIWYPLSPSPVTAAAEGTPTVRFVNNTAVVSNTAELVAALVPANSGRRVRIRAGTYDLVHPVIVPDGMTLEGEGVMRFTAEGRPTDFSSAPRTTLRMTANVAGDVITLGNDVTVRNLEIQDLPGRSGNVVAVMSRRPGDRVAATIIESAIHNPNPLTIGAAGASGRGLIVITRNPNLGADPGPDERSVLAVRLLRSVIHSLAGGGGFFAYNFAAGSRISVEISRSVIGGDNEANGGVSRPDAVHDSEVHITSRGNIYRNEWADPCASPTTGWNLTGGSGAPIPIAVQETARNRLVVRSVDDRIENFTTSVVATGSRRFFGTPLNPAPTANHIDLQLIGTAISTASCVTEPTAGAADDGQINRTGIAASRVTMNADFRLAGAWVQNEALAPGTGNTVRAEIRGVTGSGARTNEYHHAGTWRGTMRTQLQGTGNRLELVGSLDDFTLTNRGIQPLPMAEFFIGGR